MQLTVARSGFCSKPALASFFPCFAPPFCCGRRHISAHCQCARQRAKDEEPQHGALACCFLAKRAPCNCKLHVRMEASTFKEDKYVDVSVVYLDKSRTRMVWDNQKLFCPVHLHIDIWRLRQHSPVHVDRCALAFLS